LGLRLTLFFFGQPVPNLRHLNQHPPICRRRILRKPQAIPRKLSIFFAAFHDTPEHAHTLPSDQLNGGRSDWFPAGTAAVHAPVRTGWRSGWVAQFGGKSVTASIGLRRGVFAVAVDNGEFHIAGHK
jgi:hypothetical protein